MPLLTFWQSIDAALDSIGTRQPDTFDAVKSILDNGGNPDSADHGTVGPDASFFGGSGGDRTLMGALIRAGWVIDWAEARYHWVASHPTTGETLTYCEGDVLRGDTTGRAL